LGTTVYARGVFFLVPVAVCLLLSAQARAEAQKLALPQIVELSLHNIGDLASFREEKGIRDAGKTRAGLLPNPTLELEGSSGALTGSSAENSLSIGVSQEFLLSGKRAKRLALAERELEMYRWQLADRERLLRAEVQTAFYEVILAGKRVALIDRSIELNRQLYDVTKERLAAGDIPELEMNLAKVELARSEGAKIEAETALHNNRNKLWSLIGLPPGPYPGLVGALDSNSAPVNNLADLKQLAITRRPDLKALLAERNRGDSEIVLAQAEGIPNLTAGIAFTRDATAIEVGGVEGRDTAYGVAVKLSMPIPLFDRNQAGVQEARARRSSSESRLSAAILAVEREVETSRATLLGAEKILSLYRGTIMPQLEENLQLTREAYRLGEIGILAVIQEQKKFFEVNDGFLTALHDRQAALVKLESAVAVELTGGVQ
jgi:outer membrane protein, heavy metal efflux system